MNRVIADTSRTSIQSLQGGLVAERSAAGTQRLQLLAGELEQTWPDAAGSLPEGIDDTLTLMRLGLSGNLAATLSSTNPCESMITRRATPRPGT